MKKFTFDELIKLAENSRTGEVYFLDIQAQEDGEHYIDPRTERNESGINIVIPFCHVDGYYWYICPNCDEIHFTGRTGKIESGCCLDIDCQRHRKLFGKHELVQYGAIILDETSL